MAKKIKPLRTPDFKQPLTAKLLGESIKARRTQSNLRLQDAAALCGIAKDTLMKIEHGHSKCQIESILQACSGLGIILAIKPWDNQDEMNDDWF
jgi:transcriptional regulator with XRE-family HTH domain